MKRVALSFLTSVCLCVSVHAGNVVIVDGPAAGTYSNLQSAIDAAIDGDLLLVGPGTYPPFTIDAKTVSVFALPNALVKVGEPAIVRNLHSGQTVVLCGLSSGGPGANGADGLQLTNNDGFVCIRSCNWSGLMWPGTNGGDGGVGVRVSSCTRVSFAGCTAHGADGALGTQLCAFGGRGGDGLLSQVSTVACFDSEMFGGDGGFGDGSSGRGGDGFNSLGDVLYIAGCSATGGDGPAGSGPCGWAMGNPGHAGYGLRSLASSIQLLDNSFTPGTATVPWLQGRPLRCTPPATILQFVARKLNGPTFARDDAVIALNVSGEGQDFVQLRKQRRGNWNYGPSVVGPWLVPTGPESELDPLGVLASTTAQSLQTIPRPVSPTRAFRLEIDQLVVDAAAGARFLGTPLYMLVFDDAAGPDCNGNAVPDALDIATGASLDVDNDGKPDECP